MHPDIGRHLVQRHIAQHGAHRVQSQLDDRQDNQCQSRPPQSRTPRGDVIAEGAEAGPRRTSPGAPMSQITWHSTLSAEG